MNLISNAVQAMEKKGGDLLVVTKDQGNTVETSIKDTGPGIPQDKLSTIFDPFYSTKESGTGLGLPICKKIIDEHKGSIRVESSVGKGTNFIIDLPAAA